MTRTLNLLVLAFLLSIKASYAQNNTTTLPVKILSGDFEEISVYGNEEDDSSEIERRFAAELIILLPAFLVVFNASF